MFDPSLPPSQSMLNAMPGGVMPPGNTGNGVADFLLAPVRFVLCIIFFLILVIWSICTKAQVKLDEGFYAHAKAVMTNKPVAVMIDTSEYENHALDSKPVLKVLAKDFPESANPDLEREELIDSYEPVYGIVPLYTIRQTYHRGWLKELGYGYRYVFAFCQGNDPLKEANDWLKAHDFHLSEAAWDETNNSFRKEYFDPVDFCGQIKPTTSGFSSDSNRGQGFVGTGTTFSRPNHTTDPDTEFVGVKCWYTERGWFSTTTWCNICGKIFVEAGDTRYRETYLPNF